MSLRLTLLAAAGATGFAGLAMSESAFAQTTPSQTPPAASEIVVTATRLEPGPRHHPAPDRRLDLCDLRARPSRRMPGGDNTGLNQVVLQAPGVAQDSYGQLHIRGEHNGLQFRLNGVILPEGLQRVRPGAQPAPGRQRRTDHRRPARRIRPAHRRHHRHHHQERRADRRVDVSVYGGSHGEIEPSSSTADAWATPTIFVSGSYQQNDLGIESPDGASTRCTTTPSNSRASPISTG